MSQVRVWAFASVKGGAGKSALSVACARILSRNGRIPLLIDADLTGTSLADGLALRAPHLEGGPLNLRPDQDPEYRTVGETKVGRIIRAEAHGRGPYSIPYLNDALLFRATSYADECHLHHMVWRSSDDSVRYLPASPLGYDQRAMYQWMDRANQPLWGGRFGSLLELSLIQMPGLTDIVIDLSPGLFGFSEIVLRVLQEKHGKETIADTERRWEARPFLVMTPDRSDFIRGMDEFITRHTWIPGLIPVINKRSVGQYSIRDQVDKEFTGRTSVPRPGQLLRFIRNHDYLQEMFKGGGTAKLTPLLEKQIAASLELWES